MAYRTRSRSRGGYQRRSTGARTYRRSTRTSAGRSTRRRATRSTGRRSAAPRELRIVVETRPESGVSRIPNGLLQKLNPSPKRAKF